MKLLLKEFQTTAVEKLVANLRKAAQGTRDKELQSVCLASPTGSGKTVIVTAAIERILQGDDTHAPVPGVNLDVAVLAIRTGLPGGFGG